MPVLTRLEKATIGSLIVFLSLGIIFLVIEIGVTKKKNLENLEYIQKIQNLTSKQPLVKGEEAENIEDGYREIINVNYATIDQIDAIPTIGKAMAEKIVEFRKEKKGIQDLSELTDVQGMTKKKYATISKYLTVKGGKTDSQVKKLNLNFATLEEIDALPGIGKTIAKAIIDTRIQKGSFHSLDDLQDVPGLTESAFRKFEALVEAK